MPCQRCTLMIDWKAERRSPKPGRNILPIRMMMALSARSLVRLQLQARHSLRAGGETSSCIQRQTGALKRYRRKLRMIIRNTDPSPVCRAKPGARLSAKLISSEISMAYMVKCGASDVPQSILFIQLLQTLTNLKIVFWSSIRFDFGPQFCGPLEFDAGSSRQTPK